VSLMLARCGISGSPVRRRIPRSTLAVGDFDRERFPNRDTRGTDTGWLGRLDSDA